MAMAWTLGPGNWPGILALPLTWVSGYFSSLSLSFLRNDFRLVRFEDSMKNCISHSPGTLKKTPYSMAIIVIHAKKRFREKVR